MKENEAGNPEQALEIGVTVMLATNETEPVLVPTKEGIFPVPEAAKPMAGVSFTH